MFLLKCQRDSTDPNWKDIGVRAIVVPADVLIGVIG
jgi:hypothetical protein